MNSLQKAYRDDANGNRTHAFVPARGVDATMTFDAADRIATSAEATYTTDADGFVTSKETSVGTTTYRYSALGELTTVTVPSGHTITYAYDAFSRRVSRSVDGTLTDRYLWADATHLLAVYPAQGTTPTYRFTYADGRVPMSVETSAGTLRLLTDQVGTVRALVATDGAISSRVERDAFGVITSGTAGFPLGFAGGLEDADTGLVHFGAREYDPALGRWLSRDPIDFAGGDANLYGYVLGDPVGGVDPSGLIGETIGPAIELPPGSVFLGKEPYHWQYWSGIGPISGYDVFNGEMFHYRVPATGCHGGWRYFDVFVPDRPYNDTMSGDVYGWGFGKSWSFPFGFGGSYGPGRVEPGPNSGFPLPTWSTSPGPAQGGETNIGTPSLGAGWSYYYESNQ